MPFDWNQYWQNYLPQMRKKQAQYEAQNAEYQKKLDDLGQMSTYDALKAQFQALHEQNQDSVSGYQAAMQGFGLNEAPENNSFSFSSDDSSNQASGNDFSNFSTDFSNDNQQRTRFSWEKEDETDNIQTDNVNEQDTFHDSFAQETSPILAENRAGFTDNSVASTYSQNQKMPDSATKNAFWNRLGRSLISQAYAAEPTSNAYIQASGNFVQPSVINTSSVISNESVIGEDETQNNSLSLPNVPGVDLSKTNFGEIDPEKYTTVWKNPSDDELTEEYNLEKQELRKKLMEFESGAKEYLYPYLDINGNITFGYGHAVFDDKTFKSHPWGKYMNDKFAPVTDPKEIDDALNQLKKHPNSNSKNLAAESYEKVTDLRLPKKYISELLDKDIAEKEKILKRRYKNWDRLSPQIKMAMLELAFNVGSLASWKNLGISIEHMDELNNINYICGNLKRTENTQKDKDRNKWGLKKCGEGYLIPKDPIN